MSSTQEQQTYVPLKADIDYEIQTEYPFRIRRIGKTKNITVGKFSTGYPRVHLNRNSHKLHRIIAEQFLPNDDPEGKPFIDHINQNREDYHLENLRWVTRSENNYNRSGNGGVVYEILDYDEVDWDDVIAVDYYGKYEIDDVYFDIDNNRFLFDTGVNIRIMHVNYNKSGSAYVCAKSTEGKNVKILFTVFKRENNIYNKS